MLAARQRAWENTARLRAQSGTARAADTEHAALVEAVASGNPAAARQAALHHLSAAAQRLGMRLA
jgi:DNA-binding FadR family transcriptional regulator